MKYGTRIRQAPALAREDSEQSSLGQLEVNVIFTDARATEAALEEAARLATDLKACIRVRHVVVVPFSLPLDRPQISVPFAEKALSELVSKFEGDSFDVTAHLYLSRNRLQTLSQILQPNSLIVIAGRRRPWPTRENRLAKQLRALGHRVLFSSVRKVQSGAKRLFSVTSR